MLEHKIILSLVALFLVLFLWFLTRKALGGKHAKGC